MTFASSPSLVMRASNVAHVLPLSMDMLGNSINNTPPTSLAFNTAMTTLHSTNLLFSQLNLLPSEFDNVSDVDSDEYSITNDSPKSLRKKLGLYQKLLPYSDSVTPRKRTEIVGHRGALYDYLENTRTGFIKCAKEYKCDAVELDVFILPKCGTLVVFHGSGDDITPGELSDYIVGENNSNPRSIMDLSYQEALLLQFNPDYDEFPCPRKNIVDQSFAYIPTLEQVLLDLKGTGCKVKIELKGPGVVKPVIDLVEKLQMEEQCTYSSFNFEMLRELRDLRPNQERFPSGALFDGEPPSNFVQIAINVGATEVHLKYDVCTIDAITQIHNAGLKSMAWLRGPIGMKEDTTSKYLDVGNEDEACYRALIDTGVHQICCNKPDLLSSMLAAF